jgi:hypothetical protein
MSLSASTEIAAPTAVAATDAVLLPFASRITTTTGLTNIVNVASGNGRLTEVVLRVKVVPDGAPTVVLEFVVDGQTQVDEPIYTAANVWSAALTVLAENRDGGTVGHTVRIPVAITFLTSLRVGLRTTVAGGAAGEVEGVAPYGDLI